MLEYLHGKTFGSKIFELYPEENTQHSEQGESFKSRDYSHYLYKEKDLNQKYLQNVW